MRLKYALTGEYKLTISAWDCMLRVYTMLYIFFLEFVPLTLLANALERCLAVYFPLEYYSRVKTRHQNYAAAGILAYCSSVITVAFLCSYFADQTPRWPYNCITSDAVGDVFSKYHNTMEFVFTAVSGAISLTIIAKMVQKQKVGVIPNQSIPIIPSAYAQRQRALTQGLILSTVVVFLLMCFPLGIQFIIGGLGIGGPSVNQLTGPYNNFPVVSHSICSDVILYFMNGQVRGSVNSFVRGVKSGWKRLFSSNENSGVVAG